LIVAARDAGDAAGVVVFGIAVGSDA